MTRVKAEFKGMTTKGTIVARREKTNIVFVVWDENPSADGWVPEYIVTEDEE